MKSKTTSASHGFSLVELLTVISILSLLTALSIPTYLALKIRAMQVEKMQNFRVIAALANTYIDDGNTLPNISVYGYNSSGYDTCAGTGSDPSMTTVIGFSTTECTKTRYSYQLRPFTMSFPPAGPLMSSPTLPSQFFIFAGSLKNSSSQIGNPTIPYALCRYGLFLDYWYYDQDGVTQSGYASTTSFNALKHCI